MVKEKRKKSKKAAPARVGTPDVAEKQEKGSKGTQSGFPSKKKLDLFVRNAVNSSSGAIVRTN